MVLPTVPMQDEGVQFDTVDGPYNFRETVCLFSWQASVSGWSHNGGKRTPYETIRDAVTRPFDDEYGVRATSERATIVHDLFLTSIDIIIIIITLRAHEQQG